MEGRQVQVFTLTNRDGCVARFTNFGAILMELRVPDRRGRKADVVLGFDRPERYAEKHPHFGSTVGRVGNRIAGARFTLEGREYRLAANNGAHHLHGGTRGFDKYVWDAETGEGPEEGPWVKFTRVSPDGEEGYPGTLRAAVTYALTHRNELAIEMTAVTDRPTIVNLVHHTYWNLAGSASADILGHELQLFADRYTPVDETLIPTGELAPVAGTPFDFREPKKIGRDLDRAGGRPVGYDVNFVVGGWTGDLRPVARVSEPTSGRVMELLATEPGVQFYSGNFLDGSVKGKGGVACRKHAGFCLETQRYPDSVHRPDWPTVILRPGETYRHLMVHRFR